MHDRSDTNGPRVALALSGGGHRSCMFALGALLYLADAGRTRRIASVASVSGGSLANGYVAQQLDLAACGADEVEQAVGEVARRVAGCGTVFGAGVVWAYLMALPVIAAVALVGPWLLPGPIGVRIAVFVAGLLLLAGVLLLRGIVCGRAYARTLFSPSGRRTRLSEIHDGVDHVICATDLHRGENVYFSGRFVYSYAFGLGTPGGLPLHAAVQASAAFPGLFPVRWLRSARFRFGGGLEEAESTRWLALQDGGVYDNMADQWARGMEDRVRRLGSSDPGFREADELIVVNGSAGLSWGGVGALAVPIVGELATLLRDKSVLYDNGNSLRRQELVTRFERDAGGLRGALVHIPQSPFRVPSRYVSCAEESPECAQRARRAQDALDLLLTDGADAAERWGAIARANAGVATTLFGLGDDVTARLLHHAYVLAMVNLHVLLDYPLLELPDAADFERLARGKRRDASTAGVDYAASPA